MPCGTRGKLLIEVSELRRTCVRLRTKRRIEGRNGIRSPARFSGSTAQSPAPTSISGRCRRASLPRYVAPCHRLMFACRLGSFCTNGPDALELKSGCLLLRLCFSSAHTRPIGIHTRCPLERRCRFVGNQAAPTRFKRRVPAGTHCADQADPLNAERGSLRPIHHATPTCGAQTADRGEEPDLCLA